MQLGAEIQDQFCSSYDKRKLCSYDVEFIDRPTKPLIHQTSRFLFFTKGEGILQVDGVSYSVKPNTFVAILPWEISIIPQVNKSLEFIKIIYNSDFVTNNMRSNYNTNNEMVSILSPIGNCPVVYCSNEEAKIITSIMEVIKNEVGIESIYDVPEERELSNIYVTNKLIELLIHFKRFIAKKECLTESGASIELDDRSAIFKYIYAHVNERQTLSKLSALFYMSESAISKYLFDVTGLNFGDLLNEMRVVKALDLLTYTDFTLNEVADLTGFSDASHVSKVFTSRVGTTPNDYRKIYKNTKVIFKEKEKSVSFEIIGYLHNNFCEDLKVADVADKYNMTVIELNRILLFQVEKNFEDLMNYLRINRACEMLLTEALPITDIGVAVGYNTVKTFNRNFMRLKGMAPGVFRKNVLLQKGGESVLVDDLK